MSDTTGFHAPPWDLYTVNGGELAGLPDKDWPGFDGPCCDSKWAGPTDQSDEKPWVCCLPEGHSGTHRGSDSVSIVAEWRDQDVELAAARVRYAEALHNGWTVVAMPDGNWSIGDVKAYIDAAEATR